jgi:hypothetical protein
MKEQEFFENMAAVWLELSKLKEAAQAISQQMAELQQAGMSAATPHTRSDNGAMELLHPTGSEYEKEHGRRREYVGKKPKAQEEAQDKISRWEKYRKLKDELASKREAIHLIEYRIEYLLMAALGKQAKLFSDVGTNAGSQQPQVVPTDWNWLTPKIVIEYFKRSPVLAAIADDVETVLSKADWAGEAQRAA